MKKYLIALIFFFSVPLFAQQLWWVDTTSTGTPGKKVFLGEWQGTKFNINYSPMPVKLVGGTVVTDTVNFTQLDSMTAVLLLGNIELTGINTKLTTQITRHTADSLNFVAMKTRLDSMTADLATTKARADSIALSNTQMLAKNDSLKAKIVLTNAAIATLQDSLKQKINATNLALAVTNNQAHPSAISLGAATTVSTEVDTTTFTGTTWQTFGAFALDDTLQIALKGDFSDAKPVYPYTQYTFEKFSPVTFPKGYIRRLGGAGTVNYVPIIKGY